MDTLGKIIAPTTYTYNDYKLWQGDWELIKGYPQAMSPSPVRKHSEFVANFVAESIRILKANRNICNCKVVSELDWIINDDTIVRPDVMIVCGAFNADYLTFPPTLIVEVASPATRMRDRNTKFTLYQAQGVKYYIIADPDKETVELFELIDNIYRQSSSTNFELTQQCKVVVDIFNLWEY